MVLSWILGSRQFPEAPAGDDDKPESNSKIQDQNSTKVNFDSLALERAAKAAKFLENS
ncbi:MAG: hypothetical protein MHPSP_002974, partial [Paramarteilia canceri]